MTMCETTASNDEVEGLSPSIRKWFALQDFSGYQIYVDGKSEQVLAAIEVDGQNCFLDLQSHLGLGYVSARISLPFIVRRPNTGTALQFINRVNRLMLRGHWELTEESRLRFVTGSPSVASHGTVKLFTDLRQYAESIVSVFMCLFANLALLGTSTDILERTLDEMIQTHPVFNKESAVQGDSL